MKKYLALFLLFVPFSAAAQTAPDRVSIALGQCILQNEQRFDEIQNLKKQLADVQAELKTLKEKTEPKEK